MKSFLESFYMKSGDYQSSSEIFSLHFALRLVLLIHESHKLFNSSLSCMCKNRIKISCIHYLITCMFLNLLMNKKNFQPRRGKRHEMTWAYFFSVTHLVIFEAYIEFLQIAKRVFFYLLKFIFGLFASCKAIFHFDSCQFRFQPLMDINTLVIKHIFLRNALKNCFTSVD